MNTPSKIYKLVVIFIIALIAVSCTSGIDEIDEAALVANSKEQASQNTKLINLTVVINDTFGGKFLYKIEVFDSNPSINTAVLLKSGLGSKDIYYSSSVKVPEISKTLYVRQTDPAKIQTIKAVDISTVTGEIICDFTK